MKRTSVILAAAVAALVAPTAAPAAPPSPPSAPPAPFVVAGPLTIEGGERTFDGQVIVLPGSTLTVKDATIYLDGPRSCPIGGTVTFCHPQLFVMPGGKLVAEGATFDTHRPVDLYATTSGYMIYAYSGVLSIKNSTIIDANKVGGEFPGAEDSLIKDSTFINSLYPIEFIRGMKAVIDGNTIVGNRQGIHIRDADSVITNNTISVLGTGIDVQGTLVGAQGLSTRALVTGNTVTNSLRGFSTLNGYSSTVRDNVFNDNVYGAVLAVNTGESIPVEEQIVFDGNTLDGNETALGTSAAVNGGQESPIEIVVPVHGNSITNTECTSVRVIEPGNPNVTLQMDARENWWGSAEGPQDNGLTCPAVDGNALVDPWLMAPPF